MIDFDDWEWEDDEPIEQIKYLGIGRIDGYPMVYMDKEIFENFKKFFDGQTMIPYLSIELITFASHWTPLEKSKNEED